MQNINALTFKQKQEVLENVFKEFERNKFMLKKLEFQNFYPGYSYNVLKDSSQSYYKDSQIEKYVAKKEELETKIQLFEDILSLLSKDHRVIITNEFIDKRNNNWWMDYYSRSTYYRLKNRAMEEMLFYLYL